MWTRISQNCEKVLLPNYSSSKNPSLLKKEATTLAQREEDYELFQNVKHQVEKAWSVILYTHIKTHETTLNIEIMMVVSEDDK